MVNKTETQENKLEQYFESQKFFQSGDINGKKAFFALGVYTRRVLESLEAEVAKAGTETKEQSKFIARVNREIGLNMNYRSFTSTTKLLDGMARKTNPKLFFNCSGVCNQYIINSDVMSDKKSLSPADANLSFSLGMHSK